MISRRAERLAWGSLFVASVALIIDNQLVMSYAMYMLLGALLLKEDR